MKSEPAFRRAFTLVELLVATAAASLAMIAAATAISAALRSFASVSAQRWTRCDSTS